MWTIFSSKANKVLIWLSHFAYSMYSIYKKVSNDGSKSTFIATSRYEGNWSKGYDWSKINTTKIFAIHFWFFDRPASTVNECPDSPNIFHIKECISINMMASRCLLFMHGAFANVNNVEINRCKWIQCTCTWRAENWTAMNFGFPFAFNLKWSKFNEYFLKFIAKHSFIFGIKADTRKYRKFFFIKE